MNQISQTNITLYITSKQIFTCHFQMTKYGLHIILLCFALIGCEKNTNHRPILIGIQPLVDQKKGMTGLNAKKHSEFISKKIQQHIGIKTVVLPTKGLPKSAFTTIKTPRYRADSLLRFLSVNRPDSISYMLGITTSDISTTKRNQLGSVKKPKNKYQDWGIFGLGYCPGNASIVSTFRLKSKPERFANRFTKVCIHEMGYNLGLHHCSSDSCVMQDAAEKIATIDQGSFNYCNKCQSKVSDL